MPKEAMVLCAGKGERLSPITQTCPKPLVPLLNRPTVSWVLDYLISEGIERVLINVWHLQNSIIKYVSKAYDGKLECRFFEESHLLGVGGGIKNMLPSIRGEHFFCLNGDTIQQANLTDAWHLHNNQSANASMILVPTATGIQESGVTIVPTQNRSGEITQISTKEKSSDQGNFYLFSGTHIFAKEFLEQNLPDDKVFCIVRNGYMRWIETKIKGVNGIIEDFPLLDTGTASRFLRVQSYMLEHFLPKSSSYKKAPSPVLVDESAVVDPTAELVENVVIGPHCQVGAGAQLVNCVLFENTVVAANQKLSNVLVAGRVELPAT